MMVSPKENKQAKSHSVVMCYICLHGQSMANISTGWHTSILQLFCVEIGTETKKE